MADPTPLPRITHRNVADEIRRLARDSSRVVIREHCIEKMMERGIVRAQIDRCLQGGRESNYEFDHNFGNHKVTLSLRTAGAWIGVVAALVEDDGGLVVVVTAFRH